MIGSRRGRTTAAIVSAVAAVSAGCTAPDRAVSDIMADGFLPALASRGGFAEVPDWRTLPHPSATMREYFVGQSATYRVASAQSDRAELVVWQIAQAGAEPFNANVTGTGHGCVTINRNHAGSVRSDVHPCPTHLGPPADVTPTSWGRDSNAVTAAQNVMSAVEGDVHWLLTRDARGYPRRTPPSRKQVVAVIRAAAHPDSSITVRLRSRQSPGRFTATVTVESSAVDPVDTRLVSTSRQCAVADVRLNGTDPSGQLTVLAPTRCG